MTDPAIAARIRANFLQMMLPPWAGRGACAELGPNRSPWEPMFSDDIAYRSDGNYVFPEKVRHAMGTCATCQVRRECLAHALASEHREEQSYWAAELEDLKDGRRYGVYGGVPGRIRERFRDDADPFSACDEWFTQRFPLDREESIAL